MCETGFGQQEAHLHDGYMMMMMMVVMMMMMMMTKFMKMILIIMKNAKIKFESTHYMTGVLHATEWHRCYLRYFLSLNSPRRLCTEVL